MTVVLPPGMRGRISSVGLGAAFAPVSPPIMRTLPLDMTRALGYQRPPCMRNSLSTDLRIVGWVRQAYLQLEPVWVFLPIIGAIDARRTVGGIKSDTVRRSSRPATNIEDTSGLVWKHDGGRTENVRLEVHFAPSMIEIVDETQVQFVCASRVCVLGCAAFLEEGDLAIYPDSSKQRRYKARNEILRRIVFLAHMRMNMKGKKSAHLVSTDISRSMPGIHVTVPNVKLQPRGTPT